MNVFLMPQDSKRVADAMLAAIAAGAPMPLPTVTPVAVQEAQAAPDPVPAPAPVEVPAPAPTAWDNVHNIQRPLVERATAKSQGLRHYFTGKPCVNGHVTLRSVLSYECRECLRLQNLKTSDKLRIKSLKSRGTPAEQQALDRQLGVTSYPQPPRRQVRNGVTIPHPNSNSGKVWLECDRLSRELGQPVPYATLMLSASNLGISAGNAQVEYYRWRKSWGLTGQQLGQVAVDNSAEAVRAGTTRSEALRLGLRFHFTGEPCEKGHVSVRYASNNECRECRKLRN